MRKKVLLIADDDEMSRRIIRRFLQAEYDVQEAPNGRIALEMVQAGGVDALLLDIIMPEMDGLEVLERLRADHAFDALAVLVATSTKEKTERTALSLGADDVLSKPYDPLIIKKRLANILATKELERRQSILENGGEPPREKAELAQAAMQVRAFADTLKTYTALLIASRASEDMTARIAATINEEADKLASRLEEQL